MSNQQTTTAASIQISPNEPLVQCHGEWTVKGISTLASRLKKISDPAQQQVTIDGSGVTKLDSAGAWLLQKYIQQLRDKSKEVRLTGFTAMQQSLLKLIIAKKDKLIKLPKPVREGNFFYFVGRQSIDKILELMAILSFIGELAVITFGILLKPYRFQWRTFLNAIDEMGYCALPIIGLLSFLIGVVLTYQMGLQLKDYGANIYIVNLSGLAILREFAPLMTAIIVAGRTSSSLTALIGTMKVNEEVDALLTMGQSPIARLVLPRLLGLIIALPLLTLWSDFFGVLGSMVMSKGMLGITYQEFLSRFPRVIELSDYLVGVGKAPVFAMIIAIVGCFQGFQVSHSAESVGKLTTKSVVQSIFLIIIADAAFSVLFSWIGI